MNRMLYQLSYPANIDIKRKMILVEKKWIGKQILNAKAWELVYHKIIIFPQNNMKTSLNTRILLGALLGIVFGIFLSHSSLPLETSTTLLSVFALLGNIFINLLKMVMIPLVFCSIAAGIANLKSSPHAKLIWPTLLIYSASTTTLAAMTGLLAMNYIKPGVGLDIHLFNKNINSVQLNPFPAHHSLLSFIGQINILAVVLLAVLSGIAIIMSGEKSRAVLKVINKLFEITMMIVRWIMRLAPLGIMGLLTKLVAQANISLLYVLSKYILVVTGATLFHGLVTLPFILWLIARVSPWKFFLAMKEAFITAFSTSSSTATLPVSLRCITENLAIDGPIARFVLPLGATLNMDGTAMYEAMAALFVANLCGIHLSLLSQIVVLLTAMMVSVGAPGIPSAGMVTLIMVLQSVGLPSAAVGILIAIDRPLDTVRTVVNVEGDCIGACVVQKICQRTFSSKI